MRDVSPHPSQRGPDHTGVGGLRLQPSKRLSPDIDIDPTDDQHILICFVASSVHSLHMSFRNFHH